MFQTQHWKITKLSQKLLFWQSPFLQLHLVARTFPCFLVSYIQKWFLRAYLCALRAAEACQSSTLGAPICPEYPRPLQPRRNEQWDVSSASWGKQPLPGLNTGEICLLQPVLTQSKHTWNMKIFGNADLMNSLLERETSKYNEPLLLLNWKTCENTRADSELPTLTQIKNSVRINKMGSRALKQVLPRSLSASFSSGPPLLGSASLPTVSSGCFFLQTLASQQHLR